MIKKMFSAYVSFGVGMMVGSMIAAFIAGIMISIMLGDKTAITVFDIQDCLEEKVNE